VRARDGVGMHALQLTEGQVQSCTGKARAVEAGRNVGGGGGPQRYEDSDYWHLLRTDRLAGGRSARTSVRAGSSKRAGTPIKVEDEEEEVEPTPVKEKERQRPAPKKVTGKSAAQKARDGLARKMGLLHFHLYQVRTNIKALEVEHSKVMAELDDIIQELVDMDD